MMRQFYEPHGRRTPYVLLLLLAVLAIAGPAAFAQSVRGAIAGTVTDQTGAVIPGASVTAVNEATAGKNTTKSTSAGVYRFPDMPIGTYTVTVTAPGFATKVSTGVLVQVNSTAALNVALTPGGVNETVTVDASGLQLETESSDISGTVSNKQIEDLPLSLASGVGGLRSPETFVFLLPGTTGPGTGTSSGSIQGNGVFFSRLSGGQAYGAEVLLDGASIQRSENGSSFDETSPSIEALQEFKVTTSTPSAEFGRTTSGIESFATKSGGNDFHGTAYAIVKNAAFDANNWFDNGYIYTVCGGVASLNCSHRRPADSKFDYGGVFDGPVRIPKLYNGKDRSFFLFAWEKYQYKPTHVVTSTVPTAAERTGDFSDILGGPVPGGTTVAGIPYPVLVNPCTGDPVLFNQIFDPTTSKQIAPGIFCRLPYAGNKISQSLSPTAQKLIAGLPLPNQAPITTDAFGYLNNYSVQAQQPDINTTYTIRIDQNLTANNKIFATYSTRQNTRTTGAPNLPEPFLSNSYDQVFTTHYTRAGWDYTITPTLLNHLNLGYNRTNSVNLGGTLGKGPSAASLGLANDYSTFFPLLVFPSPDQPTTLGQQQNGQNIDNGARFNDSLSWVKGRNSFKFGVDVRFQQYSTIQYNQDTLNFYRDQTAAVSNACCGSGNPYASFLLGEVGNGSQAVFNVHPRWNSHYWAAFVEDDVKVSNNLTLNLGLRYSIDSPRHEAGNRTSILSLTAPDAKAGNLPGALVFGTNCNCNTAWADTWYKDISPRIGFAYVLPGTDNKMVLRGGGAILYGPLQYNDFGSSTTLGYNQNRDFFTPQTATTGGAFTPAFRLDASSAADTTNSNIGYPAVSYAPNLDPTQLTNQGGPGSFQSVGGELILPNEGRPSMTSNWSMQLQYEVAKDLLFTMGYIGQVAQNLRSGDLTNINNISPQYFSLGDRLNYSSFFIPEGGTSVPVPIGGSNQSVKAPYSTFAGALGQALRPFPQYDYIAGDCCLENLGHSSYNAMVVSLARHFRNGFSLQASYTWSKALTDADSAIPFSYVLGNQLHQGPGGSANLKVDKAYSVQDTPHTFVLSYLYQLPFGKGQRWLSGNRALDLIVGGWQIGAIQRYQSGQPISFGCASGIPYFQNCITYQAGPASDGGKNFASAAFQKNKNGPSTFNGESWFKPAYRAPGTAYAGDPGVPLSQAAFFDQNHEGTASQSYRRVYSPGCGTATSPCSFVPFEFGNLPRVTEAITGPKYLAEDMSLLKNFQIKDRLTFQIKGEVFDVFNRHRMALPDQSPQDVSSSGTTGFGIPQATDYGPRTMQVSGRITF